MKKTILALTALSLAAAFTACQSDREQTTEERLRSIYGWKGESLPAPAPNPEQTEISVTEKTAVEENVPGKDAGIVSTIEITETIPSDAAKADGKTPVKAGSANSETASVKKDDASVKAPSIPKMESEKKEYELSGETKTYIVKPGDSLWSIAGKEYKSGYKWGILYRANKDLLKGKPDSIRPGMKLTIPILKQKTSVVSEEKTSAAANVPSQQAEPVSQEKPATAAPVKSGSTPSADAAVKPQAPAVK